ncbi:GNAT family N-acetyltransferase [Planococcus liqunii]|uniref:GNAT family N-acetyltransferase n=1 Tax=Planococcus liqunii TaxID=3058394 RepID=A0ABT8MQK7_9BACL|nr:MULTISPECIES: GNAT family N-acetyltransferase [unclassified Planococcus (in: firmicutes)]MDN7227162.1 GNAT family N-acetyltransferase [Planococcus sp. N064]WKA52255.1 GNAT family N-acetyltransferase [Planococcus sp. N056]
MDIKLDDLSGKEIERLVEEHIQNMLQISPLESKHALGVEALRTPEITVWSAWEESELLGCGALKELDPLHGEVKSMRTSSNHLRKGVARKILEHIMDEAKERGYLRLSLETGSAAPFEPARTLYERFGFVVCEPFADYKEDPNSVFMAKEL